MPGAFDPGAFDPGGYYTTEIDPPPTPTADVVITVDGVDVTSKVVFATARFSQRVNGTSGESYMRIRDLDSTYDVAEGSDWLVTIDGDAAWRGYVLQKVETYIAPALNVAETSPTRFLDLRGGDQNVLFARRVVFDMSNPTNVQGTQFPPDTFDSVAIADLTTNWLDLSSDDIDLTSGVTHVASLDPAQPTQAWSGGWYWKDAMNSIAMLPAAVWYIRPEIGSPKGTLCYADVDEATAPFGLSDTPNGISSKGYREMEIVLDGTSLANDVMAWGMGYGSTVPVFKRLQSSTSQATHGLWQTGTIATGVYKQATIDRVADSILNGSPSSHRGAKNNRPYVRLVTYWPGLLAGQVVTFTSNVWGFTDNIPVRELQLTFESPQHPRYELLLSHEIDAPWGFIDQFWPHIPSIPIFVPPRPPTPPGTPQPSTQPCDCGITDTFTRTVAEVTHLSNSGTTVAPIGTSDSGVVWTGTNLGGGPYNLSNGGIGAAVNGSELVLRGIWVAGGLTAGAANYVLPAADIPQDYTATKSFTFRIGSLPINGSGFRIGIPGAAPSANIYGNPGGAGGATSYIGFTSTLALSTAIPNGFWVAGVTYTVTELDDGTSTTIAVSNGTTTYAYTRVGYTNATIFNPTLTCNWDTLLPGSFSDSVSVYFDNLDIPEITRCSQNEFDNFNRMVGSGWGTATPSGAVWTDSTLNVDTGVDGAYGFAQATGSVGGIFARFETSVPPGMTESFEEVIGFWVNRVSSADNSDQGIVLNSGYEQEMILRIGNSTGGFVPGGVIVASTYAAKTDWTTDYYRARLSWNAATGEIKARVWLASDPEPTSWLVTGTGAPGALPSVKVELDPLAVSDAIFVDFIDFDYNDKPCYPGGNPPVVTLPTSPSSYGCETATRVTSTSYRTSVTFTPGSTLVWIDGLLQERTVAYTEDSDLQHLDFSDAVDITSRVTVCYFGRGPQT
jgi:hypothetical protein